MASEHVKIVLEVSELEVALWSQEQVQAWLKPDIEKYTHDVSDWALVRKYCDHGGKFRKFDAVPRPHCPWCKCYLPLRAKSHA